MEQLKRESASYRARLVGLSGTCGVACRYVSRQSRRALARMMTLPQSVITLPHIRRDLLTRHGKSRTSTGPHAYVCYIYMSM